jgi:von Willebrand factor type A domain
MEDRTPGTAEPVPANLRDRNVLLLDLSRSMLAPLPDPEGARGERQKIEVARTAVYRILQDASRTGVPFGLVTFTDVVRVPVPLGPVRPEALPYIENLISVLTPSGRSAIWDAIGVGADLLRSDDRAVHGTLVLVTDGWDNASNRFGIRLPYATPPPAAAADLLPHLLAPGSELTFRVIGIGDGSERDRGVDASRMNGLLAALKSRAAEVGAAAAFTFQAVTTGSQLFAQMVQAFLDIGYADEAPTQGLAPEELAAHAATAARALKEPQQHGTVTRLRTRSSTPGPVAETSAGGDLEIGVLSIAGGTPEFLKDRYGPLGEVIEAYLAGQNDRALTLLAKAAPYVPPVSRSYWEARIQVARGATPDAARCLLDAWAEAEKLPEATQAKVARRLALLQARMQNDRETETLVRFIDETEQRLAGAAGPARERLMALFDKLMELRGTYQLTRLAGEGDLQDAAQKHEEAVEEVFGHLQDARLELGAAGPEVEGALDFIEICLAEMR